MNIMHVLSIPPTLLELHGKMLYKESHSSSLVLTAEKKINDQTKLSWNTNINKEKIKEKIRGCSRK